MKTIEAVLLAASLVFGSGCAKSDWIQQTLVTVDVTGTWQSSGGGLLQLDLEQQGSKVKGSMRLMGNPGVTNLAGPIDGTVSGDTFSFRGSSVMGNMTGNMTVNGDEMIGKVQGTGQAAFGGRQSYTLQRVPPLPRVRSSRDSTLSRSPRMAPHHPRLGA